MVWASYEDPSRPDVVHNRIVRADDYLAINARGGSNEQQHARSVIVFLYTVWESDLRPRLAQAKGTELNVVCSDIMGDLKELRHAIIHGRSVLSTEKHRKLKKLSSMFKPEHAIVIHRIGVGNGARRPLPPNPLCSSPATGSPVSCFRIGIGAPIDGLQTS